MRIRQQYSMTDPAFLRQKDALPQKGMGPVNHQIPLLISQRLTLFPDFCLPTKLQVGSVLNRVFLSVSLSVCSQGGPHVTTTHNTIDQSEDIHVGNFPLPAPPPLPTWGTGTPQPPGIDWKSNRWDSTEMPSCLFFYIKIQQLLHWCTIPYVTHAVHPNPLISVKFSLRPREITLQPVSSTSCRKFSNSVFYEEIRKFWLGFTMVFCGKIYFEA